MSKKVEEENQNPPEFYTLEDALASVGNNHRY
jgi:hypothetical protein